MIRNPGILAFVGDDKGREQGNEDLGLVFEQLDAQKRKEEYDTFMAEEIRQIKASHESLLRRPDTTQREAIRNMRKYYCEKKVDKKVDELLSSVSHDAMKALSGEQNNIINSYDEGVDTSDMLTATRHDDNLYGTLPKVTDPIIQILTRHGITDLAQSLEVPDVKRREKKDRKLKARSEALKYS